MNNKILMIVNSFPPSGESGVQRPVKFLKYFAKFGWDTFVITPQKPVMQINKDNSLEFEIPSNTKVYKTFSLGISEDRLVEFRFEFGETKKLFKKLLWHLIKFFNDLLFPIDKQIGWVPFALIKAIKLINFYKISKIYITASPFSAFLCGVLLKKIYGKKIFWVADYRDAWQFAPVLDTLVLPFRKRIISKMDSLFIQTADYVIFPTDYILKRYQGKYGILERKSEVVTNGYDEDDFMDLEPKHYDKFTFAFMGKFNYARGNPFPLLHAIKNKMKADYQYIHVGIIGRMKLRQIKDEGFDFYEFRGYKPHKEALSLALGADINMIIINNDSESEGVYSGKLFELIRAGKPVLAVGPRKSVIKDLFSRIKAGIYAYIEDTHEIENALEAIISGSFKYDVDLNEIKQFSRESCSRQLEKVFLNCGTSCLS